MKFRSIAEAQEYLFRYRKSQKEIGIEDFKFARVQRLAALAGNPQHAIKVIHVAGTSGKGSTCHTISRLLTALGKETGLSVSPHVYDIRERAQINNENLSEEKFLSYVSKIVPFIESMEHSEYGLPSFFEIMIILAYSIFAGEDVDYAVMETGMGGRLDASNVATGEDKIAVLTKIGLDHTDMLGKTVREIATQKAAIIHKKNTTISIKQRPQAQLSIAERAKLMKTSVQIVIPGETFSSIRDRFGMMEFNFSYKTAQYNKLELSLSGQYQVENTAVALATCYEVAARDGFDFDEATIRDVLRTLVNPGRFDELSIAGKKVIIDGAHNPQKMSAFIRSLTRKYPDETFDFMISFKHGKDFSSMLKYIVPIARKIYATEFVLSEQVETMSADTVEDIVRVLDVKFGFKHVEAVRDAGKAFSRACVQKDSTLVVTGSLYLVSELYRNMITK